MNIRTSCICRKRFLHSPSNGRYVSDSVFASTLLQCGKRLQIGNCSNSFLIEYLFSISGKLDLFFVNSQLCRYYEFRDSNPELHIDVNPFSLTRLGEDDIVSVTPYRDQVGRRVMIYKIGNWRPSKIPIDDIFRVSLLLFEMGALEPQTQVVGGVGIFDMEGLSLNHAWYVTPSVAKKIIALMVVSAAELSNGTMSENLLCFRLPTVLHAGSNDRHPRDQQQLGVRHDLPDLQAIPERADARAALHPRGWLGLTAQAHPSSPSAGEVWRRVARIPVHRLAGHSGQERAREIWTRPIGIHSGSGGLLKQHSATNLIPRSDVL